MRAAQVEGPLNTDQRAVDLHLNRHELLSHSLAIEAVEPWRIANHREGEEVVRVLFDFTENLILSGHHMDAGPLAGRQTPGLNNRDRISSRAIACRNEMRRTAHPLDSRRVFREH